MTENIDVAKCGNSPKATVTAILLGGALSGVFTLWWQDVEADAHLRLRESSCHAYLKQVGTALLSYRQKHGDRLPPNSDALKSQLGRDDLLICSLSGYQRVGDVVKPRSYLCRFPERFEETDAVCWDCQPHSFPPHYLLPNRSLSRNVLFADGSVKKVSEEIFQSWRLSGADIQLNNP